MSGNKDKRPTTGVVQVSQTWNAPLPPPDALRRFDEIVPGSAKTIIDHMVSEGEHRRRMEQGALDLDRAVSLGDQAIQKRGQTFGFILAMVFILGGVGLAASGRDITGLGAVLTGGAALLGSMWFNRQR